MHNQEPDGVIVAANDWPTNAELIVDCVRLGHLRANRLTLDPTFGLGNWWSLWRPERLVTHDKYTLDGIDFRHLPHAADEFEQITYDPPYVSVGGRETTGIPDFHERYGLRGAPKGHGRLQRLIDEGLDEMTRVLRPGTGRLLVKCANYVSGGQLRIGTHDTLTHALGLGLVVVDWFVHVGDPRPQPEERGPQQHARQNASTLYVLRKPRKRAKK